VTAIYVCPLSRLSETVAKSGARHVLTLINRDTPVERPSAVAPADHLFVGIHDICAPEDGLICPAEEHVSEVLAFVGRWDRQAPIVVHCYAGISRSTASAYSAYCALRPDLDEAEVARGSGTARRRPRQTRASSPSR
jgi:predicted protein tyrosine phosphatase